MCKKIFYAHVLKDPGNFTHIKIKIFSRLKFNKFFYTIFDPKWISLGIFYTLSNFVGRKNVVLKYMKIISIKMKNVFYTDVYLIWISLGIFYTLSIIFNIFFLKNRNIKNKYNMK